MEHRFSSRISVRDLQKDAPTVVENTRLASTPTAITQGKRPAAVLMSIEAYERREKERRLLLRLARGEREIAAGEGHDLSQVLAEADQILGVAG